MGKKKKFRKMVVEQKILGFKMMMIIIFLKHIGGNKFIMISSFGNGNLQEYYTIINFLKGVFRI